MTIGLVPLPRLMGHKDTLMSVYSIVYTSKAVSGDLAKSAVPDFDSILATARERNSGCGVRGALLFTEGRFVQVLEGERAAVQDTFDRIVADPRHRDVEVLCTRSSSKPRFAEWSMAFVGDTPALRQHYANAPLADLATEASGDTLLDFMREIVRSPK